MVVVVLSTMLTGNNLFTLGNALALSLLALSLVPLSGYAGQVSLCQFTFLGLGAVTMHWVDGGGSVLGVLAAVGMCAAVGAVLALPALRLRGLYLALATLAFAVLMDSVFFKSSVDHGHRGHGGGRSARHLRHALHHRPVLRRPPGRGAGAVPHRRGRPAPGALRPASRVA